METNTQSQLKNIYKIYVKLVFVCLFFSWWFSQLILLCFQEVHRQLCSQKALLQSIMDRLKMKYSDTLPPSEIQGQLQEVTQSLQQLEKQVAVVC